HFSTCIYVDIRAISGETSLDRLWGGTHAPAHPPGRELPPCELATGPPCQCERCTCMAHQPMLLPDPSERPFLPEGSFAPARGPEWLEEDSGNYLAELAAKLASHGGGESSADLALDLMLNKIVDQARLATAASGAAIALSRDGEMVCRASVGESAPGLGVRLNTRSGVSGACVQRKELQRCDDAENDPRVDAAACRDAEIRSILAVAIFRSSQAPIRDRGCYAPGLLDYSSQLGRHCSCISAWLDGRTSGLENCCQSLQRANGRSVCRAGNPTDKRFIEEKGTEFWHHVRSTSLGRQEEGVGFLQCFDFRHIPSKGRS